VRPSGDYLKTKRALLRAAEKQANMAERLDSLKAAVFQGDLNNATSLLMAGGTYRTHGGNLESLDERQAY
jgi:hypothetical protein